MKKILFSLIAVIVLSTMNVNAQVMKIYKGETLVYSLTKDQADKVVFEEEEQELKVGDKVQGTTTINGTTYTRAVGGTVADYVDLGIVVDGKKVLWASHNLGASKPEEYGAYIAWGENGTEEEGYSAGIKTVGYSFSTLKYYNGSNDSYNKSFTKYVTISDFGTVDNKTTLESEDDAATVNWGSDWRTPTINELEALNDEDHFTWTWDDTNNGYTVTSKISGYEGKSIFLPAAGYRGNSNLIYSSSLGHYMSNMTEASVWACNDRLSKGYVSIIVNDSRCSGFSIRPVHIE